MWVTNQRETQYQLNWGSIRTKSYKKLPIEGVVWFEGHCLICWETMACGLAMVSSHPKGVDYTKLPLILQFLFLFLFFFPLEPPPLASKKFMPTKGHQLWNYVHYSIGKAYVKTLMAFCNCYSCLLPRQGYCV